MDRGRLDTGEAKGSLLSRELAVVGRVAVVSAVLGRRARPSRRGVMLSSANVKSSISHCGQKRVVKLS